MDESRDFLLLFQRPNEPIFEPKFDENGEKVVIDIPVEFYADRYKDIIDIQNRNGEEDDTIKRRVPTRSLLKFPDLDFCDQVPPEKPFCLFNPTHKNVAARLIELFMEVDDDHFFSMLVYTRDRVHKLLHYYAMSVAMQHRKETQNIELPSIAGTFPAQFVDPQVLPKAIEGISLGNVKPIVIPQNYTANEREVEQRLAYFREDIAVNLHHWHWHLVYPGTGPPKIVAKDRRGELFYYMHSQLIARYNIERFCNRLGRVTKLSNLRDPIPDAYFPKLLQNTTNVTYPPRFSNTTLTDLDRPDDNVNIELADIERWRDRIIEAIDQGFVVNKNGGRINLDDTKGIDVLGDLIEATDLSCNKDLYGELHNAGHELIAYSHDPDDRFLEKFGVMGDVATAMRDPIFYRWHAFIDSLFRRFKNRLDPYVGRHFAFHGVTVSSVDITRKNKTVDTLNTFWQGADINIKNGLDFAGKGNIYVSYTHLQHERFTYTIHVENAGAEREGTCRIFLGPRTDERGAALKFREQQTLMIEMDRFKVNLHPGANTIRRRSTDSSVTLPYNRTFKNHGQTADPSAPAMHAICGCGWPEHLLLPKGKPEGMKFDVFVMITDYTNDRVGCKDNVCNTDESCTESSSFCGIRDQFYPDRRAMGFPFDRRSNVPSLQQFVSPHSNMRLREITIRFKDEHKKRP